MTTATVKIRQVQLLYIRLSSYDTLSHSRQFPVIMGDICDECNMHSLIHDWVSFSTRKSRYRCDDRAMRLICECPENCRPM